tara:strand:- start:974 stop:1387 length:414 start_codon:yes stop_codon:yes gene_type:complete
MITMAKKRGRGGYRKPSQPAAVAGPGALSQRTDGKQPEIRMPDMPYGQQTELLAQQAVSPLGDSGGANSPFPMQEQTRPNVFAGTERPQEPITQGAAFGPGTGPVDQLEDETDIILAALYSVNPHPAIAELINTRSV